MVVESAPDWTGPIVGIIGVVLGSLMGLAGIRWQHDAQRAYDVRKLCAEFIAVVDEIRLMFWSTTENDLSPLALDDVLLKMNQATGQINLIRRHLELVAPVQTERLAAAYGLSGDLFIVLFENRFLKTQAVEGAAEAEVEGRWLGSRQALIEHLNPNRRIRPTIPDRVAGYRTKIDRSRQVRRSH
ncbi:hypothetical protein ACTWLI_12500 [Arthrobacter sp. Hor0625]|uniref:hypothetical protein n=1 Tax=Arthrobacter sp. Hor0625 TaxID=3457358 RepID=UPI00403E9B51